MIAEGSPQRERLPELDPDLRPRLCAPVRVQHHAQDAVDAEPGCQRPASGLIYLSDARAQRRFYLASQDTSLAVSTCACSMAAQTVATTCSTASRRSRPLAR